MSKYGSGASAHDVFISYSSRKEELAQSICADLEGNGFRCWLASRDIKPGAEWAESIHLAIESARVFLLVLTEESNRSGQVEKEVNLADVRKVPILVLKLGDFALSRSLEYHLLTRQILGVEDDGPSRSEVKRLRVAVGRLVGRGGKPVTFATRVIPMSDGKRRGSIAALVALLALVSFGVWMMTDLREMFGGKDDPRPETARRDKDEESESPAKKNVEDPVEDKVEVVASAKDKDELDRVRGEESPISDALVTRAARFAWSVEGGELEQQRSPSKDQHSILRETADVGGRVRFRLEFWPASSYSPKEVRLRIELSPELQWEAATGLSKIDLNDRKLEGIGPRSTRGQPVVVEGVVRGAAAGQGRISVRQEGRIKKPTRDALVVNVKGGGRLLDGLRRASSDAKPKLDLLFEVVPMLNKPGGRTGPERCLFRFKNVGKEPIEKVRMRAQISKELEWRSEPRRRDMKISPRALDLYPGRIDPGRTTEIPVLLERKGQGPCFISVSLSGEDLAIRYEREIHMERLTPR